MNLSEFKSLIEDKIDEIQDIIDENMPYKGDSMAESQKQYLTQKLNEFSYALNGVIDEDLKE